MAQEIIGIRKIASQFLAENEGLVGGNAQHFFSLLRNAGKQMRGIVLFERTHAFPLGLAVPGPEHLSEHGVEEGLDFFDRAAGVVIRQPREGAAGAVDAHEVVAQAGPVALGGVPHDDRAVVQDEPFHVIVIGANFGLGDVQGADFQDRWDHSPAIRIVAVGVERGGAVAAAHLRQHHAAGIGVDPAGDQIPLVGKHHRTVEFDFQARLAGGYGVRGQENPRLHMAEGEFRLKWFDAQKPVG